MDREPELHPSGIIRVYPLHPCCRRKPTPHSIAIAIGIAIAIETLAFPVCGRRLSACPADRAGVPTAKVENTNSKRTISTESRPCLQASSAFIQSIHAAGASRPRTPSLSLSGSLSRLSDTSNPNTNPK